MPRFFDASFEEPDQVGKHSELWDSVHNGIQLLQTHGSRNIMLSFDETVTFPTYSMMRDERGSYFIGGGDAKSRLEVGVHMPSDLRKQDLAQTIVCYVVQLGCGLLLLACCNTCYNLF